MLLARAPSSIAARRRRVGRRRARRLRRRGQHAAHQRRRCARRRRRAGPPCRRSGRRSRRRWSRRAPRSRGCWSPRSPSRRSRASRPRRWPRGCPRRLRSRRVAIESLLDLIKRLITSIGQPQWASRVPPRSAAASLPFDFADGRPARGCAASPRRCWRNAAAGRTPMKIAAAAYPIDWHNRWNDYVGKLRVWVRTAAEQGAELLVFPEYGALELASLAGEDNARDLERVDRRGQRPHQGRRRAARQPRPRVQGAHLRRLRPDPPRGRQAGEPGPPLRARRQPRRTRTS